MYFSKYKASLFEKAKLLKNARFYMQIVHKKIRIVL